MFRIPSGISEHVIRTSIAPDQHLCLGDGSGGVEICPAHPEVVGALLAGEENVEGVPFCRAVTEPPTSFQSVGQRG